MVRYRRRQKRNLKTAPSAPKTRTFMAKDGTRRWGSRNSRQKVKVPPPANEALRATVNRSSSRAAAVVAVWWQVRYGHSGVIQRASTHAQRAA